eukprot:1150402-Rhodomonas_salina.1
MIACRPDSANAQRSNTSPCAVQTPFPKLPFTRTALRHAQCPFPLPLSQYAKPHSLLTAPQRALHGTLHGTQAGAAAAMPPDDLLPR